jgi:hypothetical protein
MRLSIHDLESRKQEVPAQDFTIELIEPVELKAMSKDGEPFVVKSLRMRYPTLADGIKAEKTGTEDEEQFRIYVNCLEEINGDGLPVSARIRNATGILIFREMGWDDLEALGRKVTREFGLQTYIEIDCRKCGKHYKGEVNTASFFASALE